MPESRSITPLMLRGDWAYLERILLQLRDGDKTRAKKEYKRLFLEAYDAEPVEQKKANAGRLRANLHLTSLVERDRNGRP